MIADIATLGTGTLLAGVINTALIFLIPKLLSMENYGYWRLFVLYAGYAGFLHFGFADGALLRWAGRPLADFHHEIRPAARHLFWQHLVLLAPLGALASLLLPGRFLFLAIALALYALICNEATLLTFGLQSARKFRSAAISSAGPSALFLGLLLLWRTAGRSGYEEVTVLYILSWLLVLVLLLALLRVWHGEPGGVTRGFAKAWVLAGWPVVMVNTGVSLIVFADRLAASWAVSIHDFAQYSMAGSAMAVPITAIHACSKVFFSHLAGMTPSGRKQIYGISSRMLLIAYAILLPYYFALDLFIHHFLPKYVPSLAYARILLLAIPFLAAIQILQVSLAYLNGMQKKFLAQTIVVLAITLAIASLAAFGTGSLRVVAGVQVCILGAWWLFNEWTLRGLTEQKAKHWIKCVTFYGVTSAAYWMTTGGLNVWPGLAAYYGTVVLLLIVLSPRRYCFCPQPFRRKGAINCPEASPAENALAKQTS